MGNARQQDDHREYRIDIELPNSERYPTSKRLYVMSVIPALRHDFLDRWHDAGDDKVQGG
jgi:hypothetical protein